MSAYRPLPWQCALLGKADPRCSCQTKAVQKSQESKCSFQIQVGKKCWKSEAKAIVQFLPLLVIVTDFIAGQGKVLCFYGGLL